MKIALVQIEAIPGNVEANIDKHLRFMEQAAAHHPHLIAFPELSLTGYEPELAGALATDENDIRLEAFRDWSQRNQISITVGLPLGSADGIHIGMLIFHPDRTLQVYRKQMLNEDEKPFFIAGKTQIIFEMKGVKVAPTICYEAFQESHLLGCLDLGADIYLASVSKHIQGLRQAYEFMSVHAQKHSLPILMVNSVGYCDNFLSAGGTAAWATDGTIRDRLGNSEESILVHTCA